MLPPLVLWIDPGDMTGLAWLDGGQNFYADEFPFMQAAARIETTCRAVPRGSCWTGWETYTIDPRRPQINAHDALGMIGIARMWAYRHGCQVMTAEPGQRNVATRVMLEAIGWWIPAKNDAQSAAAHMLAWLLRVNEVPPRERQILDRLKGKES